MINLVSYLFTLAISMITFWSRLKAAETAVNLAHRVLDLMERVGGYFRKKDDQLVTA